MSHYEERLENDLNRIRSGVQEVGGLVQKAIRNSVRALLTGNEHLAHMTVLNDNPINRATRRIDRLCHQFIAVHLPTGAHLRLMSSVIRTDIALERIGDYAVTICREGLQLERVPHGAAAREIALMSEQVLAMLEKAVQAFFSRDDGMARATMGISGRLETTLDGVYDDLLEEGSGYSRREVVAMFVVFNMLKRVSDQAKNLCEEVLFAATGETKPLREHHILFVDERNDLMSQLAAAIARRQYSALGEFHSAGRDPAQRIDPGLLEFMQAHGLDTTHVKPRKLAEGTDLASYDVVVSLQGSPRNLLPDLPFHTAALQWDAGDGEGGADEARMEEIYRQLSVNIRDLVQTLWGEEEA